LLWHFAKDPSVGCLTLNRVLKGKQEPNRENPKGKMK
jgi:hypothetical protein